jgi:hypothetical protein
MGIGPGRRHGQLPREGGTHEEEEDRRTYGPTSPVASIETRIERQEGGKARSCGAVSSC